MIALLFDLFTSSWRTLAGGILAVLIIASVWQAVDGDSYGASYFAAGFAGLWLVLELVGLAWRRRRSEAER